MPLTLRSFKYKATLCLILAVATALIHINKHLAALAKHTFGIKNIVSRFFYITSATTMINCARAECVYQ